MSMKLFDLKISLCYNNLENKRIYYADIVFTNDYGCCTFFPKGQLISKCLYGVIVSTKIATKRIFALKVFKASLGLHVGFLINDMTYYVPRKPQKASKKPPGRYKKYQGRNPYNILVAILVETRTPKRHFEIN